MLRDLLSFAQSGYPPTFHSGTRSPPYCLQPLIVRVHTCHQSDCSWAICPIRQPKKICVRISRKSVNPTQIVRPLDRETGRARGFAFVEYAERTAAEEAIKKFDGQLFMGRPLAVSEARAREDRGPGGPPRPAADMARRAPAASAAAAAATAAVAAASAARVPAASAAVVAATAAAVPGAGRARQKDFGPPAPPKDKKKPFKKNEDKPRGPDPDQVHGPHV